MRALGQNDGGLGIMAQIVQRRHQRPAVHLGLVDLLGAVVKPGRVAQTHGVGCGEQAEGRVWGDDLVLIEQCQLAIMLQHALDHEHHVGPACVIFVEHDCHRVAQRPRQDAFVELGHLLAIAQLDRVFADQVDPADMAVKVDAHRRPVQPRADLFDMGRFARAVIALDHHPAVIGKARQNGQSGVGIELVGRVDGRHAVGRFGKAFDLHIGVDAEHVADRDLFGGFLQGLSHCRGPSSKASGPWGPLWE